MDKFRFPGKRHVLGRVRLQPQDPRRAAALAAEQRAQGAGTDRAVQGSGGSVSDSGMHPLDLLALRVLGLGCIISAALLCTSVAMRRRQRRAERGKRPARVSLALHVCAAVCAALSCGVRGTMAFVHFLILVCKKVAVQGGKGLYNTLLGRRTVYRL